MTADFKPGDRVGAVLGGNKKRVEVIGFGVYEGRLPIGDGPDDPVGGFAEMKHEAAKEYPEFAAEIRKNPRIKLDSGETVWGCECWWGAEEGLKERMAQWEKQGTEVVMVSIDAIRAELRAKEGGK